MFLMFRAEYVVHAARPGGAVAAVPAVAFIVDRAGGQLLAGLESDGLPGGDRHLLPGARVSPDASLTGLHDENAEAAKLYTLALCQGLLHGVEKRIDHLLGLLL